MGKRLSTLPKNPRFHEPARGRSKHRFSNKESTVVSIFHCYKEKGGSACTTEKPVEKGKTLETEWDQLSCQIRDSEQPWNRTRLAAESFPQKKKRELEHNQRELTSSKDPTIASQ